MKYGDIGNLYMFCLLLSADDKTQRTTGCEL